MINRMQASRLMMGIIVVWAVSLALFPRWTVDDAYISLRYAENLARHGELNWNVGEAPIEGYTGILWPLLAAGLMRIGLDALIGLKLISFAAAVSLPVLTDRILLQLQASQRQRLLALLIMVPGPWWYMHTGSGLETMLYTALILGCVLAFLQRSAWLPVVSLVTALTRPEAVLLSVLLAGADWRRGGKLWGWMAWWLVPASAYMTWRIAYYGELLPNTFYAKGGGGGWYHLLSFASNALLFPFAAWLGSQPAIGTLRPQRGMWIALCVFAVGCGIVYARSELLMNYGHRFFVPLLPLVIIGLAASWGERIQHKLLVAYGVICALTLIPYAIYTAEYAKMDKYEHQAAAAWITANVAPDATLMVIVDAGIVPYKTRLRTIDVGALNDPFLARTNDTAARLDYLFNANADVILLSSGDLGIVAAEQTRAAMLADPRWQAYRLAERFQGPQRFEYHQEVWVRWKTPGPTSSKRSLTTG